MTDKHSFFLKLIRGIEGEAQRSEAAANVACDRVNSISKSLRASEQRHEKVLNSLKIAESKAADLFLQQSKTRKKLFSLYSSLQSAISISSENSSAPSNRKPTDADVMMNLGGMNPLFWWRISILCAFHVGSLSDFTRHVTLRKETDLLLSDGVDSSHCDNIMPICQYFLLGTCLDDKCLYSHPVTHLGLNDAKSMKKSRGSHFAWILEKHRQYLLKSSAQEHQSNSSSVKPNTHGQGVEQSTPPSDPVNHAGNNDHTEIRSARDYFSKKNNSSGRYFKEKKKNKLIYDNATIISEQSGWVERYIEQCTAVLVKHRGSYEESSGWIGATYSQSSSSSCPVPPSSAAAAATTEQRLLSCFCFNLLYGLSYKDHKQRDVCIRSCLQVLCPYIDHSPLTPGNSSLLIEAWKLFLILSIEGSIIEKNFCQLYWQKLVLHLETLFPMSPSLQPLLAAVCRAIADASEEATAKRLTSIEQSATMTDLDTNMCTRYLDQSSHLGILDALSELERKCNRGQAEVALEALCLRLLLPSPFQLTQEVSSEVQCLPRDLAFSIFFALLFTGKFIGRKLVYSGTSLLVMCDEINSLAAGRVLNLFRRCPHLRDFVRDAFVSCFKSVDGFRHFGRVHIDTQGGSTDNYSQLSEMHSGEAPSCKSNAPCAALSAVEQSILWSYLLFLSCVSEEDRPSLEPYQVEEVRRFCDPCSYPGVYEGAKTAALRSKQSAHSSVVLSVPEGSSEVQTSSSSSPPSACPLSLRIQLLAAMDSYLGSAEHCTVSLQAALGATKPGIIDPSTLIDQPPTSLLSVEEVDIEGLISDIWTKVRTLSLSYETLVPVLVEWMLKFKRETSVCTEIQVPRFTAAIVALCSTLLDESRSGMTAAFYLNILYTQVLAVVKIACGASTCHATSVQLLEMVFSVAESSLRIEESIAITAEAEVGIEIGIEIGHLASAEAVSSSTGKEEDEECLETKRKRKRGGLELPPLGLSSPTGESMRGSGITSLDCCTTELDCIGPTMQTRLLERTLDLLDSHGMMNYNIVELLLQSVIPSRGSAELLVSWILNWFRDPPPLQDHQNDTNSPPDVDQGRKDRWGSSSDIIPPGTSLKSSILIANAFQTSRCASSLSFLRRLSPRSLFQLSFHFLRAENFDLFSTAQSLLGDTSSFSVLLRSFCETDMLSHQIAQYKSRDSVKAKERDKDKDRSESKDEEPVCHVLSENLDLLAPENDRMLQRFQESLNDYPMNRKRSLDLSHFVPKGLCNGIFPFQSLTLFSEQLLVLDISSNFLTSFPSALLFFFQLRKLNISHNEIKSLPLDLGSHLCRLENLDLSDNKFCVFPPCVLDMKSLEELLLGMNSLEYLPLQVKGLSKLHHLDISNNKFKVLSSDLTHIRYLKT